MIAAVLNKQKIVDIAVQQHGAVDFMFDVAIANNVSITDELTDVHELTLPTVETTGQQKAVSTVLLKKINLSASGDDAGAVELLNPGGIGYMIIEDDFIIT